jgi:diguanylate cyclase (GGDEF)-like protein
VLRYEYFLELAQRDLRMARRDGRRIMIVMLEVNDLDIYRQTFGEKAADSCLRMVTAQVTSALRRSGDLCARAHETGIVALVHGQEIDQVQALARRIEENVRGLGLHNPRGRSGRYVTVQFGFAGAVPESAADLEHLIAEAREDLRSETPTQQAGSLA